MKNIKTNNKRKSDKLLNKLFKSKSKSPKSRINNISYWTVAKMHRLINAELNNLSNK